MNFNCQTKQRDQDKKRKKKKNKKSRAHSNVTVLINELRRLKSLRSQMKEERQYRTIFTSNEELTPEYYTKAIAMRRTATVSLRVEGEYR